jgi:tight adherence protein B
MIAVVGGLVGLITAVGVVLIVSGLRGVPDTGSSKPPLELARYRVPAGLAVVGAIVGFILTGWPAVALAGAGIGWMIPSIRTTREARKASLALTDGLAVWADMLRDTIAAHAGLREAIAITAAVAPPAIRPAVQRLAARAEHESLVTALARFADELQDPIADLIVSSLTIAAERQAQQLAELLSAIATSSRQQASMRIRVETGRSRIYASSRSLVFITLLAAVGLILFAPKFMDPYDTVAGQFVLCIVGALFAGAVATLIQLGRPVASPRLLAQRSVA